MNRRGFLSLLGSAAAIPIIAELDLIVPERTIFLPPRNGWFVSKLPLREMRAHDIRKDIMFIRYDAAWRVDGEMEQHSVDMPLTGQEFMNGKRADYMELARKMLQEVEDCRGLSGKRIAVPLSDCYMSRYV